ncbi:MAG: Gfo/Idh/MocA family oxidoreductase [Verrucomicrobia bacterium]|nr:Gfo/Idh/MocA family oxidoreductase [Verrucomicrobiota bacterium]
MNRRSFLHGALAAGAISGRARAADQSGRRLRTALIGAGWWGGNVLGEAIASRQCEIVGICDVDQRAVNPTVEKVTRLNGDRPRKYRDFREMLDREKPEIVIVTTPDHWHALCTIAAVRAGAHVYVDKPTAHTIGESQAMVRAARSHGRVVQVGTHRRTSPHMIQARDFIRGGGVGTVGMVRCHLNAGGTGPEQPLPTVAVPPELDWDLWCGPAPLRQFNGGDPSQPDAGAGTRGIHPRGHRQYLDYANGYLGDAGIHWFDLVLWITGEKWPRRIHSTGGRPVRGKPVLTPTEQTSDAPDHQVVHYGFESLTMTWESRLFGGNGAERGDVAAANFYGTKGTLHLGYRGGWTFYPADGGAARHEPARLNDPDGQNIRELWADFLDAIKTGRRPVSDIEEGHRSTNCSLLGMISYRLGRSIEWDGVKEVIPGDAAANQLLRRAYRKGWEYPA